MTQIVEDLRIRRTRKLLQKALLDVTAEKGFAHISVRDIADQAMVNRATFYRHYVDKYDLLRQYIEELSGLIDWPEGDSPSADGRVPSAELPPAGLVKLLQHMQANADFYRVMLGKQGDSAFCAESFRGYVEDGFRQMLPNDSGQADLTRPPIDMSISYVLQAGMGAIVWWLGQGQAYAPEQVAMWLYQLSIASLTVSLGLSDKV